MLSLDEEAIAPASANRSDEARADVHATGFWGRRQGPFFDIRVFHPNTPSYLRTQPASESMKWRRNGSTGTVRSVEHGSFTPLVFSTFGSLGRETAVFYSRLPIYFLRSTAPLTLRRFL